MLLTIVIAACVYNPWFAVPILVWLIIIKIGQEIIEITID